ncbi:IFRD domain-containing protein [Emericellopsis atlantica]|uniref:IFRD domain-containing protein n=1 Tax=Emericellopsis atlantica TaxID=2614577 RepID=A0A9P8CMI1_9HYPO|nr:IFRD domain-containing protein [Emericellopsis atlantica]KAG9252045.1 IFRD domain-containing protein [Emericellopsis atlantica]
MSGLTGKELKGEGKTTSRKARKSGRALGTATPSGSELLHRVFNQDDFAYRSENEGTPPQTPPISYEDDEYIMSGQITPAEGLMTPDDREAASGSELGLWDPKKLVHELQDKKTNRSETREMLLEHYNKTMRSSYNEDMETLNTSELIDAFIRGANSSTNANERSLNLQAYSLTICTANLSQSDMASRQTLKQILTDDSNEECKVQALYALTCTIVYYGAGEDDIVEWLDFIVETIQSNGESIGVTGKDGVITALFECWGFAATFANIWYHADSAMDAFVEKLDSPDVDTQTSAAECIAYIFEASREHEQEDGEPFELPYDPIRVASRITDLSKGSSKSKSKQGRKDLRGGLRSVITSLEKGVGPYYSTARSLSTNKEQGYRYKLRKRHPASSMGYVALVESWDTYLRIAMLKKIFGGGMEKQLEQENPMVKECLEGLDWSFVTKTDSRVGQQGGYNDVDDY